ncbi:MAG: aldo/keto reductase [Phycisphaerae bacterium]|jgi:aryl-alcohol dehydrogenase-like predicted oxidoreductase
MRLDERRSLGSTGLRVSPLGLGTVKLGRSEGVKYPHPVRIPTDAEAAALIARAEELGINLIDTAPAYGTAEERLGSLLSGRRDRWVICTKVGEEFEGGVSRFDFSARAVTASLERSLRRLRADVIDVALIHSDGLIESDAGEPMEALARLKAAGKIRAIGASTKTAAGGMRAVETCDVVMLTLNPGHAADLPAIALAADRGVGVLVKKAFGSGHLAMEEASRRECLRLALSTPGVSSVIAGTASIPHLEANVAATTGQ